MKRKQLLFLVLWVVVLEVMTVILAQFATVFTISSLCLIMAMVTNNLARFFVINTRDMPDGEIEEVRKQIVPAIVLAIIWIVLFWSSTIADSLAGNDLIPTIVRQVAEAFLALIFFVGTFGSLVYACWTGVFVGLLAFMEVDEFIQAKYGNRAKFIEKNLFLGSVMLGLGVLVTSLIANRGDVIFISSSVLVFSMSLLLMIASTKPNAASFYAVRQFTLGFLVGTFGVSIVLNLIDKTGLTQSIFVIAEFFVSIVLLAVSPVTWRSPS